MLSEIKEYRCPFCREIKPAKDMVIVQGKPRCKLCIIKRVKSKKQKKFYCKKFKINYRDVFPKKSKPKQESYFI